MSSPMKVTAKNAPCLLAEAEELVEAVSVKSHVFDKERENSFPRLRKSELDLGRVLGSGGFCVVNEVIAIKPSQALDNARYEQEEEDRNYLKSHCIRNGDARYAIKTLSDHTKDDAVLFMKGAFDLAIESRFLAVVEHPNIIRMRAVSDCSPYDGGFFIIVDRLYCTLEQRMPKWREKEQCARGIVCLLRGKSKQKLNMYLVKRLLVACDICCAMMHFHRNNIIYRDLKPGNIGFDVRDDVKIFDLGLVKEIQEEDMLPDGTFNLTGMKGSLRYMVSVCQISTGNFVDWLIILSCSCCVISRQHSHIYTFPFPLGMFIRPPKLRKKSRTILLQKSIRSESCYGKF